MIKRFKSSLRMLRSFKSMGATRLNLLVELCRLSLDDEYHSTWVNFLEENSDVENICNRS
jgi:hypothetical protein